MLEQLPSVIQRKSVELVWYLPLPSLTSALLSKLALCVNSGKYDGSTMRYLVQIVHLRYSNVYIIDFSYLSQFFFLILHDDPWIESS